MHTLHEHQNMVCISFVSESQGEIGASPSEFRITTIGWKLFDESIQVT
jgi:hypothetical protein